MLCDSVYHIGVNRIGYMCYLQYEQIQDLNQYASSLNQNIAVQNHVISSFKTDHLIKRHLKSDLRKSEIKSKLFFFWPSKKSHYLGKIKKCKYMLSLME